MTTHAPGLPEVTDLFMPRPVFMAQMHAEQFPAEFLASLPENLHVFSAFEREALRVVKRGMTHYSARTIVEVLRHHSALNDTDSAFKLNDHATPSWARLFALMHPEASGLFEFRETKAARREGAFA
jgi:hypothetical protein